MLLTDCEICQKGKGASALAKFSRFFASKIAKAKTRRNFRRRKAADRTGDIPGDGAASPPARRTTDRIGRRAEGCDCGRLARVEYSEGDPDLVRDAQPRRSRCAGRT